MGWLSDSSSNSTAVRCCYCGQCIGHDVCVKSTGPSFLKENGELVCDDCAPVVRTQQISAAIDDEKNSVIIMDSDDEEEKEEEEEAEEEEEEHRVAQAKTEIDTQSLSEVEDNEEEEEEKEENEVIPATHCPLDICFCAHGRNYSNRR